MPTTRSQSSLTAPASGRVITGDQSAPGLGQTSPREAREAQETIVRDITSGHVIARTLYRFTAPWGIEHWVCDAIADHFDASRDDVRCADTDEGRFYSIDGKPVAYVDGEYEPLFLHLQDAAE